MKNLKRKCSLVMAIVVLFTAAFGLINPMEAKAAWENLQTGQFNAPYTYPGKTVTYELNLPSSGVVTQIFDISSEYLVADIYDSSGDKIYSNGYDEGSTYSSNFWLIGGTYYVNIHKGIPPLRGISYDTPVASFKWTFKSANESFNENQDNRNNDLSMPSPIKIGKSIKGQFAANDYKDIYSFSVSKRGALTLKITDYHKSGLDISLVSEDGSYKYEEENIPRGKKNITL